MILCEGRLLFSGITTDISRRLKEQFSGSKRTSLFLMKNKPLFPIKTFKCMNKKLARQASEQINQLKKQEREDFIIKSLLRKQQPLNLVQVSAAHFEIFCGECGFKSILKCKRSDLDMRMNKFKCIHEIIKEKIDILFEQAILGAGCFHNGRFMFQGKNEDKAIDYLLGFSESGHRKRKISAYETLDEISFKNSYLLLSAILEESYNLIKEYADQYSKYDLPENYHSSLFEKNSINSFRHSSCKLRFRRIAHLIQLIANVLKHTGGIIKDERSGKALISRFKFKKNWDVVAFRHCKKISGLEMGNIFDAIVKSYVFFCDFAACVFEFKNFRVKSFEYHNIPKKIVRYDVRETYKDFLKKAQQDGSFMFIDN